MSDATNRAKPTQLPARERQATEQGRREKGLSEEAARRIGDELKVFYDGLVQEPLPDRFVQLLQQLEQREKADKSGNSGGGE
ncbi:hypothetical protein SAMN06265365_13436 [Tistlia consotensis]|uniref:Anti-sigma factor NepR domain-containing protein n=1 Tax=Tistlia consotensis USBA 355 TaxID=560819 RepID=A0A1Y6CNT6_9PROT|nr:NepR family anti-sigma factor [Tistlia consotensis]SMF79002.1 hypothetical protein SAMN05428998_13936 [Tistlia consotensis USBA 355]SNS15547.1 hypothetical protein SAMN06265365_13436 [Tistlia consotensis]